MRHRDAAGPGLDQPCVWMTAGIVSFKLCDRDHRCETCAFDRAMAGREESAGETGRGEAEGFDDWRNGDRRYVPWHVWAMEVEPGAFLVGLDRTAVTLIGRVAGLVPPRIGAWVERGAPLVWISDGEGLIAVCAPLGGTVVKVNSGLVELPSTILADPYGQAWLVELVWDGRLPLPELDNEELQRVTAQQMDVLLARARHEIVGEAGVGVTLADGGFGVEDLRRRLGTPRFRALVRSILG